MGTESKTEVLKNEEIIMGTAVNSEKPKYNKVRRVDIFDKDVEFDKKLNIEDTLNEYKKDLDVANKAAAVCFKEADELLRIADKESKQL